MDKLQTNFKDFVFFYLFLTSACAFMTPIPTQLWVVSLFVYKIWDIGVHLSGSE